MKVQKTWHKVKVPVAWRPNPGDELVGTFIGTEIKEGPSSHYKAHFVRVRGSNIQYVTGAALDNLLAVVELDTKVKIVFNGMKPCSNSEFQYKDFDLFTEEEIELKVAR